MALEKRTLLVPHDFTPVADNAVKYALNMAKLWGLMLSFYM